MSAQTAEAFLALERQLAVRSGVDKIKRLSCRRLLLDSIDTGPERIGASILSVAARRCHYAAVRCQTILVFGISPLARS